jgi:predicted ATPase
MDMAPVGVPPRLQHTMITSFKADNFRCFKHVELSNLRRINVIVGQNAAGKTALLEGVRLALGATPQVAFTLNQYRGISYYALPNTREVFESQWNWLFFGFDPKNRIRTECKDTAGHNAILEISYDPTKAVTSSPQPGQPSLITTIVPLVFDRTDFLGRRSSLVASVQPQGGLNLDQGPELGLATEFFSSTWFLNPQQNAQWFSQLSLENREKEVVDAVRKEFDPLIDNLQVLSLGSQPYGSVYASAPFLQGKIPLSLMSAGINKFFTILSAILYRAHGVVLIDEIENGIYYERLQAMWQTLWRLTTQHDTQIFVTTHSSECLQALLPILEQHEADVSLLRAERDNGSSRIVQFEGRELNAALEKHGELR